MKLYEIISFWKELWNYIILTYLHWPSTPQKKTNKNWPQMSVRQVAKWPGPCRPLPCNVHGCWSRRWEILGLSLLNRVQKTGWFGWVLGLKNPIYSCFCLVNYVTANRSANKKSHQPIDYKEIGLKWKMPFAGPNHHNESVMNWFLGVRGVDCFKYLVVPLGMTWPLRYSEKYAFLSLELVNVMRFPIQNSFVMFIILYHVYLIFIYPFVVFSFWTNPWSVFVSWFGCCGKLVRPSAPCSSRWLFLLRRLGASAGLSAGPFERGALSVEMTGADGSDENEISWSLEYNRFFYIYGHWKDDSNQGNVAKRFVWSNMQQLLNVGVFGIARYIICIARFSWPPNPSSWISTHTNSDVRQVTNYSRY